jgi:hypothetical protein
MIKIKVIIECDEARCLEQAEALVDQDYEFYHYPDRWVELIETSNGIRQRKHYCPEHIKGW